MAIKEVSSDGVSPGLAGMSKTQLYDIMSQMKTLIEQNKQQARQILVQNPALTRALFQAQIMLGMVQPPQAAPPTTPSTTSPNSQPSAIPAKQPNFQTPTQVGPNQIRKQQPTKTIIASNPLPQSKPVSPPNSEPQSAPSHLLSPSHQPSGHLTSQPSLMPMTQSPQFPNSTQLPQYSTASQPLSHHQPPMPPLSTQSQQPIMQNIGGQYLPLQPPLPPQPRPQMLPFSHQVHSQAGPNLGFQHPSGPQMHPSQHMFHSGTRPPTGPGPSFPPQGQLPHSNQPLLPSVYQAGGPHQGMEFKQPDRGSNWISSGAPENEIGSSSSSQLQGPPSFAGQMSPGNQPPPTRPPPLSPDMEKALLQQVMSLTPEQINMLPTEQRNQILQLQQMLRRQ